MIIHEFKKIPKGLEKQILKDSIKEFNPITAYTLVNGCIDDYFYKKINISKVNERYSGDYVKLLVKYYNRIKKYIECNELYAICNIENEIYEISKRIPEETILCDNRSVTYDEIKFIFQNALFGIQRLEAGQEFDLGIDSAIWNYTKKSVFFDYDPPKILEGDSLFITKNDEDYKKRVLYRNFNYLGMRTNALGTIFLGNENWNFNIENFTKKNVVELIDIMIESISDENEKNMLLGQIYGDFDITDFDKHPINILRKELKKNDKNRY